MPRHLIAQRLKEAMGLHAPTVGMVAISSVIDKRMRERNIDDDQEYLNVLTSEPEEMKQLTEAVLIPETWFFRENQPYEYVLKLFKENPRKKINILSIPCSTGEEPYSIAMMLLDNNISVDSFSIDAVDIGEANIAKAQKGQYRKNSFRANDLSFMDKYFHQENNLFNISGFIKNQVRFYCNNVLSDSFNLGAEHYDVVFCRNLLIYFDGDTQYKMFSTINKMLKPDGILILGHAETIQYAKELFVPAIDSNSYVYVKKDNLDKSLPHAKQIQRGKLSSSFVKYRPIKKTTKPFSNHQELPNKPKKTQFNTNEADELLLDSAFLLADEGKLDEALKVCHDFINKHTDSTRAYYLCGVIYDTKGDIYKADESLHKAIYLDPNNIEALIHLSLIAEQRGNHDEATRLKQRAQRVQERHTA